MPFRSKVLSRRHVISALGLSASFAALVGCTGVPQSPNSAVVSGSASFRERIALPPDAVFEATLLDVSRPGAPATVLGSDRIQPVPGPVIAFRIPYDAAAIDPRMSYSVRATITVGGQLWFTTDTMTPVLTRGNGNTATLALRLVRSETAAPAQAAPLVNTYWRLTVVEGRPVQMRPGQREPHLVLADDGAGRRNARALFGCNSMTGGYQVQGSTLQLTDVRTTLMACVPPLDQQENDMKRLLQAPVHWRIDGQRMRWIDAEGRTQAEFEAVALR